MVKDFFKGFFKNLKWLGKYNNYIEAELVGKAVIMFCKQCNHSSLTQFNKFCLVAPKSILTGRWFNSRYVNLVFTVLCKKLNLETVYVLSLTKM